MVIETRFFNAARNNGPVDYVLTSPRRMDLYEIVPENADEYGLVAVFPDVSQNRGHDPAHIHFGLCAAENFPVRDFAVPKYPDHGLTFLYRQRQSQGVHLFLSEKVAGPVGYEPGAYGHYRLEHRKVVFP